MFCGGLWCVLWCFVVFCGVLWWFVVFCGGLWCLVSPSVGRVMVLILCILSDLTLYLYKVS